MLVLRYFHIILFLVHLVLRFVIQSCIDVRYLLMLFKSERYVRKINKRTFFVFFVLMLRAHHGLHLHRLVLLLYITLLKLIIQFKLQPFIVIMDKFAAFLYLPQVAFVIIKCECQVLTAVLIIDICHLI